MEFHPGVKSAHPKTRAGAICRTLRAMNADLPEPAARWVADMLGRVPPAETHATCASCALCDGGGDGRRPKGRVTLAPDVKCCSDRPVLPNYLVGAVLADGTPDGQRTLRARMSTDALTPLGLGGPPGTPAHLGGPAAACPHLVEGRCSIHGQRNAGCATWFCKHERGLYGRRAWQAVQAALRAVESRLSVWCCAQAGVPDAIMQHLLAQAGTVPGLHADDTVPPEALWAGVGPSEAFFVACHERVSALAWSDVVDLAGPEVRALAAIARTAWDTLDAPPSDALRPGIHQVVAMGAEGVLAETYSPTDPIGLPSLLLAVLHHFDGRPTAEVLDQLSREQGLALDAAFLRELVDFNVLSGSPDPS